MTLVEKQAELHESISKVMRSYDWFKWIAILSLINTVLLAINSNISFIFGLAVNQFIYAFADYFRDDFGNTAIFIGFFLQLVFPLIYYGLFRQWNKFKKWPIIVGVILYGIDGLLYLVVDDMVSILFHAYVMYAILKSYWEIDKIKKLTVEIESLAKLEQENILEVELDSNVG